MDSIELQIGQQNSLTLQSQNRFQESHSSDRLLPPRNATPNDSMSSSGCKFKKKKFLTNNKIILLTFKLFTLNIDLCVLD